LFFFSFYTHTHTHIQPIFKDKFPRRNINDLKACSKALLKLAVSSLPPNEDMDLKADVEVMMNNITFEPFDAGKDPAPADIPPDDIPYPGASKRKVLEYKTYLSDNTAYVENLIRKGRNMLLRFQMLHDIREKIRPEENHNMPKVVSAPPVMGWTAEDDRNILIGVVRYGYGQWELTRNDPSLNFIGRFGSSDVELYSDTVPMEGGLGGGEGSEVQNIEVDETKSSVIDGDGDTIMENSGSEQILNALPNDDVKTENASSSVQESVTPTDTNGDISILERENRGQHVSEAPSVNGGDGVGSLSVNNKSAEPVTTSNEPSQDTNQTVASTIQPVCKNFILS